MPYTNAIFYVDLYNGNNAARTPLTGCTVSNTTGTTVNVFYSGHGLTTGAVVDTTLFEAYLNGEWEITAVDNDNFTLDTAVWVIPTTGTTGTVTPRGGSSWADAWLNISGGATAARIKAGDEIRISKTPDPISIGTATWTFNSSIVTIDSSLTKSVSYMTANMWVASANVTTSNLTMRKYGGTSNRLNIQAAFTTGKAAYASVTGGGTQDFSGYQKINFWTRSNTTLGSGVLQLWLCSDATGDVPVHIIPIPSYSIIDTWHRVVWDNGGPLSSTIQSISLQVLSDPGTPQISFNNIFASNDLTLYGSLGISNDKDNMEWYPIQYVDGNQLCLDTNNGTNTGTPYKFSTKTVETFFRPFFKVGPNGSTTSISIVQDTGTNNNLLTYTGGWNTTNNERDGLTVWGTTNMAGGYGIYIDAKSYVNLANFGFCGFNEGIRMTLLNTSHFFNNMYFNSCAYGIRTANTSSANRYFNFNSISFINNLNDAVGLAQGMAKYNFKSCKFISNNEPSSTSSWGIDVGSTYSDITFTLIDCEFIGNYGSISSSGGQFYCKNCSFEDVVKFNTAATQPTFWYISNLNKNWGEYYQFGLGYRILSKADVTLIYPNIWQIYIINSNPSKNFPIKFKIGEFLTESGQQLTISLPVKKQNSSTSFCRLVIYAEEMLGIEEDIEDIKQDNISWDTLEVSITPTQTVIIPVYIECYYLTGADNIFIGAIDSQIISLQPTQIDDLICWYEADVNIYNSTGGTIQDGQAVARWEDLSENAYHLTGTTGPIWDITGGTNNLPAINFNGTTQWLQTPSFVWPTDELTIYVLFKFGNATRNTAESIISRWTTPYKEFLLQAESTASSYAIRGYTTNNNNTSYNVQSGVKSTTFRLLCVTLPSNINNGSFFYNEGLSLPSYGSNSTTSYNVSKLYSLLTSYPMFVGRQHETSTTTWFEGSICAIAAFSRELTTWERCAIDKYFYDKWSYK